MRKLIAILLFLAPILSNGQNLTPQGTVNGGTRQKGGFAVDSIIQIPKKDTTSWFGTFGNLTIRPQDGKLYYRSSVTNNWYAVSDASQGPEVFTGTLAQVRSLQTTPLSIILTDYGGGTFFKDDTVTVDNTGTQIINGIGQGYSRIWDSELYPEWWGAKGDSVSNDRAAIQACLEYAYSFRTQLGVGGDKLTVNMPKTVIQNKTYKIDSTVLIKSGLEVEFRGGQIVAGDTMKYLVWTSNRGSDYEPGAFSNARIKITGTGILNGANKTSYGFWGNTMSECSVEGITAINNTLKQWDSTEYKLTTVDSNGYFVSNGSAKIERGDGIRLWNATTGFYERGAYTILEKYGDTLDITPDLIDTLDFVANEYYIVHMPAGFQLRGNQNTYRNLTSKFNGVGFIFAPTQINGKKGTVIGFDDNFHEELFSTKNEVGAMYNNYNSCVNTRSTFQHNFYENLIVSDCGNLTFDELYSELGVEFLFPNSEKYAVNYIHGNNVSVDAHCPLGNAKGWKRFFEVSGIAINISVSGQNNIGSMLPNPNVSGDYAVIKIVNSKKYKSPTLYATINNYRNLQKEDSVYKAVIDETYTFPYDKCLLQTVAYNSSKIITVGNLWRVGAINFKADTAKNTSSLTISDKGIYTSTMYLPTATIAPIPLAGAALAYYPAKGALRVGNANSTNMLDANVGQYSFSSGNQTSASGIASTSHGVRSFASANSSFASGTDVNVNTSAQGGIGMGNRVIVSQNGAAVFTDNSTTGVPATDTIRSRSNHRLTMHYQNGYDLEIGTRNSNTGLSLTTATGFLQLNYRSRPALRDSTQMLKIDVDTSIANRTYTKAQSDAKYEVLTNKSTATGLGASNTLYPTQLAVKTYVDSLHALQAVKLTATQVIDFPSLSANAEGTGVTVAVTGALITDNAIVNIGTNEAGILYKAVVTATDTVTIYPLNVTVNTIDPASATFKVMVLR